MSDLTVMINWIIVGSFISLTILLMSTEGQFFYDWLLK